MRRLKVSFFARVADTIFVSVDHHPAKRRNISNVTWPPLGSNSYEYRM